MSSKFRDMAQTINLATRKGVGSVRWQRPQYRDFLPPCNQACPAGENIQGWLDWAQSGQYEKAWRLLIEDNPMPAIHGRACYHPCEDACNRGHLDTSVSIHAVERFLGDLAIQQGWPIPVSPVNEHNQRILIIGAGPAGISCAYHLARMGYQVEIRDSHSELGGMMNYGIPSYRLPRDIVHSELERIVSIEGITFTPNRHVDDVMSEKTKGGFDAVFVSVGAGIANHIHMPMADGKRLIDALPLLEEAKKGQSPALGRTVAIMGAGNVAMDAARTAHRLGAQDVLLIYRRDPAHMPALINETEEAFAEGVKIKWLSTVDQFGPDGLLIEKMALAPDGSVKPTGQMERLAADSLVLAIGEHADLSLLSNTPEITTSDQGEIRINETFMSGAEGVFAGGDCVGGIRTITAATGHGKHAARNIDAWLQHTVYHRHTHKSVVGFEMLHLPDYLPAPQHAAQKKPVKVRDDFEEIVSGLPENQTRFEAQRCLACGNCFECDNCYAACPEQAIIRLGPGQGYKVDFDLCSGCGVCFEQCPCHAIEMISEPESEDQP
ncbi:NAD(P)-binding protein, partial [Acidihalobacter prosperus]